MTLTKSESFIRGSFTSSSNDGSSINNDTQVPGQSIRSYNEIFSPTNSFRVLSIDSSNSIIIQENENRFEIGQTVVINESPIPANNGVFVISALSNLGLGRLKIDFENASFENVELEFLGTLFVARNITVNHNLNSQNLIYQISTVDKCSEVNITSIEKNENQIVFSPDGVFIALLQISIITNN